MTSRPLYVFCRKCQHGFYCPLIIAKKVKQDHYTKIFCNRCGESKYIIHCLHNWHLKDIIIEGKKAKIGKDSSMYKISVFNHDGPIRRSKHWVT